MSKKDDARPVTVSDLYSLGMSLKEYVDKATSREAPCETECKEGPTPEECFTEVVRLRTLLTCKPEKLIACENMYLELEVTNLGNTQISFDATKGDMLAPFNIAPFKLDPNAKVRFTSSVYEAPDLKSFEPCVYLTGCTDKGTPVNTSAAVECEIEPLPKPKIELRYLDVILPLKEDGSAYAAGDILPLPVSIQNTSKAFLECVEVDFPVIVECGKLSLEPGQSHDMYTHDYVLTQEDIDACTITPEINVTAIDPKTKIEVCATAHALVEIPRPAAKIMIEGLFYELEAPVEVGDIARFNLSITNNGEVPLAEVVIDGKTDAVDIDVGEVWYTPGTIAITQEMIDECFADTTCEVSGVDPKSGQMVVAQTRLCAPIPKLKPKIKLKSFPQPLADGTIIQEGTTVVVMHEIENIGEIAVLSGELTGLSGAAMGVNVILPGDTVTFSTSFDLTQAHVDACLMIECFSVEMYDKHDNCAVAESAIQASLPQPPAGLKVDYVADPPTPPVNPGDAVSAVISIYNSEIAPLREITIAGTVEAAVLGSGQSLDVSMAFLVNSSMIEQGYGVREVEVTARDKNGNLLTSCINVCVPIEKLVPKVEVKSNLVTKEDSDVLVAGTVCEVEHEITNTGPVAIESGRLEAQGGDFCVVPALAPGDTHICSTELQLTQADIDNCQVTDCFSTEVMTRNGVVSCGTSSIEASIPTEPEICVATAGQLIIPDPIAVGEIVSVVLEIENCGPVPFTYEMKSDDFVFNTGNSARTLNAGNSVSRRIDVVLTQEMIDDEQIMSFLQMCATTASGKEAQASVTVAISIPDEKCDLTPVMNNCSIEAEQFELQIGRDPEPYSLTYRNLGGFQKGWGPYDSRIGPELFSGGFLTYPVPAHPPGSTLFLQLMGGSDGPGNDGVANLMGRIDITGMTEIAQTVVASHTHALYAVNGSDGLTDIEVRTPDSNYIPIDNGTNGLGVISARWLMVEKDNGNPLVLSEFSLLSNQGVGNIDERDVEFDSPLTVSAVDCPGFSFVAGRHVQQPMLGSTEGQERQQESDWVQWSDGTEIWDYVSWDEPAGSRPCQAGLGAAFIDSGQDYSLSVTTNQASPNFPNWQPTQAGDFYIALDNCVIPGTDSELTGTSAKCEVTLSHTDSCEESYVVDVATDVRVDALYEDGAQVIATFVVDGVDAGSRLLAQGSNSLELDALGLSLDAGDTFTRSTCVRFDIVGAKGGKAEISITGGDVSAVGN